VWLSSSRICQRRRRAALFSRYANKSHKNQWCRNVSNAVLSARFERLNFGGCTVMSRKRNYLLQILLAVLARGDVVDLAEFCAKPGSQCHTVGKDNRRFGRQRKPKPRLQLGMWRPGFSRSALTSDNGEYSILALARWGIQGYRRIFRIWKTGEEHLAGRSGQAAELGFTLSPGEGRSESRSRSKLPNWQSQRAPKSAR